MQAISYYISLPFIYLLSYLPFSVLHILSNFIAFILYKVVKYRRKIVWINLKNSFPEKTEHELKKIEKEFYGIMADYMIESLKSLTISKKEIQTLGTIQNSELLQKYKDNKQNVIISLGHIGSQELLNLYASSSSEFDGIGIKVVYSKLNNTYFERLFKTSRQRFGSLLYTTKEAYLAIEDQELKRPFAFFLLNDQSAQPNKAYWADFLSQETCFYKGSEIYARRYNLPVIYAKITRPKRNHFKAELILITDKPNEEPENFITDTHIKLLEENIIENPSIWFWSHKRWKHRRDGGLSVYDIDKENKKS